MGLLGNLFEDRMRQKILKFRWYSDTSLTNLRQDQRNLGELKVTISPPPLHYFQTFIGYRFGKVPLGK